MALFDRYTIDRCKEFGTELIVSFLARMSSLFSICNANLKSRLISLGALGLAVLLIIGLFSMFKPAPEVPAAQRLLLKATDEQGDVWTLDPLKNQHNRNILNTDKTPGQPLTLKIRFQKKSQQLGMLPDLTGAAGEQYFPGILKNGKWQPAPMLVIHTPEGELLHEGQFEYG